jgi:hypothetical protein
MPPTPAGAGRWAGLGEVVRRMVIGTVSAAVAVGSLGALIGWGAHRGASTGLAAGYYIVGSILFLLGMFPSGGFSLVRGTLSRRRPTGSRQEPVFLLGLVLIALGVVADLTRPF